MLHLMDTRDKNSTFKTFHYLFRNPPPPPALSPAHFSHFARITGKRIRRTLINNQ